MTIRVAYDEQIFLLQRSGGISRYFTELVGQFRLSPELGIEPVVLGAFRNTVTQSGTSGAANAFGKVGRLRIIFRLTRALVSKRYKSSGYDVLHLTFYLPCFLERLPNLPKVVTLFDMIPELTQPGTRNPHFQKKMYLSRADAVISISSTATSDMSRVYGFRFPVTTTHLGVSESFRPGLEPLSGLNSDYFIFVGDRGGYKNWKLAMQAFSGVAESHPGINLVLVGGGRLSASERRTLRVLGIRNRVHPRPATDSDLARLYSNAKALIYPSTMEGFGLPLVEAMASGIPIVALSSASSLEVCGEIPVYFEKNTVEDIRQAMFTVLRKTDDINSRIEAGLRRAKRYTWYNCARATAKVYQSLVKERVVGLEE